MLTKSRISFEDGDRAELALAALRRAVLACRVDGQSGGSSRKAPFSPVYCANLYYPHAATLDAGRGPSLTGSVLGSREIVYPGAPVPSRGGVRLEVGAAPEKTPATLAILRNRGGCDAH